MTKSDEGELSKLVEPCPPVGSRFRHYKGGEYLVVGAGILEATREAAVLYRPADGEGSAFVWIRSLNDWNALVSLEQGAVRRFQRIE